LPSTSCPTVAGNVFDFTTKETDPLGNDTVHTFCATGIVSGVPVANQYREIETQYYQGSASGNKLLRTVQTAYGSYQHNIIPVVGSYAGANGIINTLPTTITTTTPAATTTDVRQYSQLFTAARIYCIGSNCSNAQQLTIPIS
jgi:hypothetical protein